MPNAIEKRLSAAIMESHEEYKKPGGPQSNKKLKPLHAWVQHELQRTLGSEYETQGLDKNSGTETKIEGRHYTKRVDVAVSKSEETVGVVSVKFITSNFRQNANNYFEHLLGETANLKRSDLLIGHILCTTQYC